MTDDDRARRRRKHAHGVRAVVGVPVYNAVSRGGFGEAVDCLLGQAYPRVAFVFVDDCSSDGTFETLRTRVADDVRVHAWRNERRLGLVGNWRRTFALARERFPQAPYFAWGSDHDLWDRRWLDTLVRALDANPGAVLAYPRMTRVDGRGEEIKGRWPAAPRTSTPLLLDWAKPGAGKLVYGLFRAEMLERAGVLRFVHEPDTYLMVELSLYGDLHMVPKTLWRRRERPGGAASGAQAPRPVPTRWQRLRQAVGIGRVRRQHRALFPAGVPLYARLPPWVQHVWLLFWRLAWLGRGRPYVSRLAGARYAIRLLLARAKQPVQSKKKRRAVEQEKLRRVHAG